MTTNEAGNKSASQTRQDDTGQAPESGEPAAAGRSHGRMIDEKDETAAKSAAADGPSEAGTEKGNAGKLGEDFESGRQDAM